MEGADMILDILSDQIRNRDHRIAELEQRIAQLEEALKMITKGAEMASHEFDDPNDATEAFSYLNICIEQAKSLLK